MEKTDVLALIRVADDFVSKNEKEYEIEQLKTACLINAMSSFAPGMMADGSVQICIDDCVYKIEDAYLQGYLPRKRYQNFCRKQKKAAMEYKTTNSSVFNEIKELEGIAKREWLLDKLSESLQKQPFTTEEALVKENENLKAELEKYKELYRKEKIKNKALRDRIQFSYLMNRQKKQSENEKANKETVESEQKINKAENLQPGRATKETDAGKTQETQNEAEKPSVKKEENLSESRNAQEVQEVQEASEEVEKEKEERSDKDSGNGYNDASGRENEEDANTSESNTSETQEPKLSARYQSIKFTSEKKKGSFCFDAYTINVRSWAGQFISQHSITIFPFYAEDLKKGFCVSVANGDDTKYFYSKFDATYIDVELGSCIIRISLDMEKDSFKTTIISITSDSQYNIEIAETLNKRPEDPTETTGHIVLPYGDGINVVHILPIGGNNDKTSNFANYIYVVEDGTKASGGEINNGSCPVITNGEEEQKIMCAWQNGVCVAQLGDPENEYR